MYRSRTASKNLAGYFKGNNKLPWYLVLLGIMGTQASAITFISGPGQAFSDGMRFVQYYFGLPLAMIVICITFVPVFHKLKVYTAYEYLETRFDKRTRTFAAIIFLVGRGLSTGISIVAPSIVLSTILGWNVYTTNIIMGGVVIIYTLAGGAKAVAYTQQLQFVIILLGLCIVAYFAVHLLPAGVGYTQALATANDAHKLNIITTGVTSTGSFDWNDKFNVVSGIIGGFFLALSYFGTDQSQVGRYISASSVRESRKGLLLNGLFKIPMQFAILFIGVLIFSYYQYRAAPINFNKHNVSSMLQSAQKDSALYYTNAYDQEQKALQYSNIHHIKDSLLYWQNKALETKLKYNQLASHTIPKLDVKDSDYVLMHFVTTQLPIGLVGLLIAMLFLAAWGSIAAALNALASSTIIDIHKQYKHNLTTEGKEYTYAKRYTLAWGIFCIIAAQCASSMGSLIVAVNVLGSLFYGIMLGIFLIAFYVKYVKATAIFIAAVIGQLSIFYIYFMFHFQGFLWLNVIGVVIVLVLSVILQFIITMGKRAG